ncbi:hypothetical protein BgiMline_026285 [Biomphalaria glabrata]|uniref:Uncharacterized protein LOC129921626 n=1 Tax=Biomphalaria glabrata TaxID=6526 RepID=A0A9W2Y9R2_BIOGL|nr:uncharacterized protein LOC129921626 [Biomphalaria glabrata]XP_055859595.1 uncharacterized protein LOC129921626 [Biomphalaria glabrata]KAI8743774.1 CAunnamed protein product [Biomphalaria glabrata]
MELSVRVSKRLQAKKDSLNIQASEPESFLNVLVPEPVSLKNVTQNNVSGLTPSAIRYRRHREKLQADPEKFAAFKEKDRKRSVLYRQNITPEKRERARLLSNLRTQKCRQKKKELGLPLNEKKVKPETRAAVLERREKERLRKAAYRAKLSPHEKAWINRKRKERKQQANSPQANSPLCVNSAEVGESLGTGFQTPVAKRMAVSRALMKLPRSPKKYAAVVEGLSQIRSPRRSKALQDIGFLRLPERRKLIFLNNINESIKTYLHSTSKKRSQMSNARRQVLCNILTKYNKFRGCATHFKHFGFSRSFMSKCKSQNIARKKRSDCITQNALEKIHNFYSREDVSRTDPSQSSVSARTGKPKRFMQKTLKEAYTQLSTHAPTLKVSFSKFAKLKPFMTKATQHNKMQSCLCEFCMKIFLYMEGINKFLIKKGHRELTLKNPASSLDLTLCPRTNANCFHKLQCIERSCSNCGVDLINKYFEPLKNCMDELAEWSIWSKMTDEYVQSDGTLRKVIKWRPVNKEGPFNDLVTSMQKDLEKFSLHLFTANWQQQQFADLKQDLPCDWLLLVSDFGQNFTCHHQDEIQGAHWARTEVTIHPVVSYYRDKDLIVKESMVFLSNDLKHDGHASQHFQMKVIYELANRGHAFTKVISFSDGCAAQYKGKLNFVDLSFSKEDTNVSIERHYFGSRHGKGPCDAEIGVKKNATLAIKRRMAIISDAKGLFLWAKEYMTKAEPTSKRTFFLVEQGEINRDRPDRSNEKIRSLQGSRSVHAVRGITPYNIAYRKRSCFCFPCRNSDGSQCLHDEICGSWNMFKLQKQNVVQSQSNLESSLDVSPICSNSKAQTLSSTNQKYIVNSCVIVKYGEIFYPGVVTEVLDDQRRINFLKRHRNKRDIFVYPEVQDIQLVYADMIVTEVMLIPNGNSLREWRVEGFDF